MSALFPEGEDGSGIVDGLRQLLSRLRVGRRTGDALRYDRLCAELGPACESIDRTDFLSGVEVEPFLRLADGAGRG